MRFALATSAARRVRHHRASARPRSGVACLVVTLHAWQRLIDTVGTDEEHNHRVHVIAPPLRSRAWEIVYIYLLCVRATALRSTAWINLFHCVENSAKLFPLCGKFIAPAPPAKVALRPSRNIFPQSQFQRPFCPPVSRTKVLTRSP